MYAYICMCMRVTAKHEHVSEQESRIARETE